MTKRIAKIESWYDRKTRSYVTKKLDAEGNQIGDANYDGTKAGRDASVKAFERERVLQDRPPHQPEELVDETTGRVRLSVAKTLIRHRSGVAGISVMASVRWYRAIINNQISLWRYRNGLDRGVDMGESWWKSVSTDGRLR